MTEVTITGVTHIDLYSPSNTEDMVLGLPIETVNVLLGALIAFSTALIIEGYRVLSNRKKLRSALIDEITQIKADLVYIMEAIHVRGVGEKEARSSLRYNELVPAYPPRDPPYNISKEFFSFPTAHNKDSLPKWMTDPDGAV